MFNCANVFVSKLMSPNIRRKEGASDMMIFLELNRLQNDKDCPIKPSVKALRSTIQHGVFRFGNTHYRQNGRTAIGKPPACDWTIKMFALLK